MVEILCLIPARSGSKGITHKNIKLFKGKPLIAWTIEQAQKCKYNLKIVVSTDSDEYRKIALELGAEVPFLRPNEIAQDLSTDIEFIKHAVDWLKLNQNYNPELILQLRPTSPLRKVEDINKSIEIFLQNKNSYDSLRSVVEIEKSPYKMYNIYNNVLTPLFAEINNIKEPINQCRQVLPTCYLHNGYIDILKTELLNKNTISGTKIYPFVMDDSETLDIDNEKDWVS